MNEYKFETHTLRHQEWIGTCKCHFGKVELQMFKGFPTMLHLNTYGYNGVFEVSRDADGTWKYYGKQKEVDDMLNALYELFIHEIITSSDEVKYGFL